MEMTTRMIRINKKLALAASLTAVVVGVSTGVAFAAGDTDDSISPPNTSFVATSTNFAVKVTVNGLPITITCKGVSLSGTTPGSGLGLMPIGVSFSGCTTSTGGTVTVTMNTANGSWQLTFIDSAATGEETQTEPNTGDAMQITIPKAGATFTVSGCTISVAPSGPVNVVGSYDDMGTLSFNGVSIPVSGAGCVVNSVTITGTFKFGPGLHDVS